MHQDLHDGLGPTLASVYQRVDLARHLIGDDPDAAARLLADAGEQTRYAIADIRRLVYQLRPPSLDELGLAAAVEEACRRLNADPDGLTIEVHADPLPPLPAVVEVAAYRIAVEGITNVVRHARASLSTIRFTVADHQLGVAIGDNGDGIDPDAPAGVGLTSMRQRAEEIGGRFAVAEPRPHGTLLPLPLPLPPAADNGGHQ